MKNWYILFFAAFFLVQPLLPGDITAFYKKGTFQIEMSPHFGQNIDWESLFPDKYREVVLAPDGTLFVSNLRQHNIYQFSPKGELVRTFGRKGKGPGDLLYPGSLSILDRKYLVAGGYATERKIHIFDLKGNFFKQLKTGHNVFSPVALRNGKIAYLSSTYAGNKKDMRVKHIRVIIKDIVTNQEKALSPIIKIEDRGLIRDPKSGVGVRLPNYRGKVIINRTREGLLLVGASNSPEIAVYSETGRLVKRFTLDFVPIPVTSGYIKTFKAYKVSELTGDTGKDKKSSSFMAKVLERTDFQPLFGAHLPYYYELLVDREGNFLFLKTTGEIEENKHIFRVYSPEGRFICETVLMEKEYGVHIGSNMRRIVFAADGIYGLFHFKNPEDADEELYRLGKMSYQ